MDKNRVLSTYLELCDSGAGFLQFHLASNVVLDFFGRSVCGKERVIKFMRYSLSPEFIQHFEDAALCDAIEYKPSHAKTKIINDKDKTNPCDIIKKSEVTELNSDDCVTPITAKTTPVLPKVTQGRKFKLTKDDVTFNNITPALVTPDQTSSRAKQLFFKDEPSTKRKKLTIESDVLESSFDNSFYFKHKTLNSSRKEKLDKEKETETKVEVVPSETDTALTDLMYFECIGVLHTNPNVGSNITHDRNTPNRFDDERKTRLKISYRVRHSDKSVLFYLIIYENLERNPIVRRNLYSELQTTAEKSVKKKAQSAFKSRLRLF